MSLRDEFRPGDLPVHNCPALGPLVDSFGHAEAEFTAVWIIRYLAQTGNAWRPFGIPGFGAWIAEQRLKLPPASSPANPFIDMSKGWR
jgi:hypothetical protein